MIADHQLFLARSRRWAGQAVGLYGGSFNPAHAGHIHVSFRAIRHLRLDSLWWLVSPLNPLKHAEDMAALGPRVRRAQHITANYPKIQISALEDELGSRFSVETIARLRFLHPKTHFIWIMGADNLASFHHWEGWQDIFKLLPVAVIDRPGYALKALSSPAARRFRACRIAGRSAARLKSMDPPAWTFLRGPLHPASATAIRAKIPDWAHEDDIAPRTNAKI